MHKKHAPGVTLTELMVATAIIGIAFLALINTFGTIAASIQTAKVRTLANNLAQERIQILKQISYTRLMVTPAPSYRSEFNPAVPYDTKYYPVETIFEGGISFERLTYVQMATEVNGVMNFLGATPDTGMKAITVTVIWREGNKLKSTQLRSMYANPNTIRTNSQFKGTVRNATTALPISDAIVWVAENAAWKDITFSTGAYNINLNDGTYTLMCSARGYFGQSVFRSIGPYQTLNQDFTLTPMDKATLTGTVWKNEHPVISQVVASTYCYTTNFFQEYIELYNPTTWTWTMSSGGLTEINVNYYRESNPVPQTIQLDYAQANSVIPSHAYYLIANTTTVEINGSTIAADATYNATTPDFPNVIKCIDIDGEGSGAVELTYAFSGKRIDCLGWDRNSGGKTAPACETEGIDQNIGLQSGEQYVRRTSTLTYITDGAGRCYDCNNNDKDFFNQPIIVYPPLNTSFFQPAIAGTPAGGVIMTCEDGLSNSVSALTQGYIPVASFQLLEVATGTWGVYCTSGTLSLYIASVTVTTNGEVIGIPNAYTDPAWPVSGYHSSILDSEPSGGYISGRVLSAAGGAITPAIKVSASSNEVTTTATGRYLLPIGTGTWSVTANQGNEHPQYVSQMIPDITVELGQVVSDVNFTLSEGGLLKGWVTRDGINPLPDVLVTAIDNSGVAKGQEISGNDGSFTFVNLSTGPYSVAPELDTGEMATPSTLNGTVTIGNTVFVGTFTVTGAFGKITGSVQSGSKSISTGVLIVASTGTFVDPPSLSSSTFITSPYYFTNSYENGTYVLEVRGSTTTAYTLKAYYPVTSKTGVTINTDQESGITVTPGGTHSGVNFSW